MATMVSFVWFTIVVVGILVSSLAMISMGAACWDYCSTVPLVAQYLVITGSVFFCLLITLLLLTFCVCTSSGDPKISGPLKVVYGISAVIMFFFVVSGSTVLFATQTPNGQECNRTNTKSEEDLRRILNITEQPSAEETSVFCSDTLQIFSYSVLVILHMMLFFSLLVTFYTGSGKE